MQIKKQFIFILLTSVVTTTLYAASSIDTLLGQIHSLKANFTQTIAGHNQMLQQSEGVVMIAEPNRFLWQVNSPNKQLYVSDGVKVWNDEEDLNQVLVSPLNTSLSATPLLLLSGRVEDINQVFTITKLSDEHYRFTPKKADDLVKSIELTFVHNLPSELLVNNNLGQITDIHFTNVKLNPHLDPGLFIFTPGPNDNVMK